MQLLHYVDMFQHVKHRYISAGEYSNLQSRPCCIVFTLDVKDERAVVVVFWLLYVCKSLMGF